MPRPKTKSDLILAANAQFAKLWELIGGMSEEEKCADIFPNERDKNVRDVLVHLYEWHCLLLNWIKSNASGKSVAFLPEPYNWKTYPAMNVGFWKKHRGTPYVDAEQMLKKTHKDVMSLIETFSDDKLFSKGAFDWTGTTTLGSYCVSATSSHYDWAIKCLKKALKKHRET
ncbi:ClbS/DfsB family four-helix bundle protein [Treponema parvum]|uniref:ClbS/DfsB family four-helix bundle protein n=1 Tax=Treponema parvum TaxID=138851 RepID=A0A975IDU2_9SPIR|nr:ClbS/DfsB family four-helix bundle protein [Treponema parvum]QTQ13168.1 ClbS/DfsB family four-helix bundle protein [Treponema parvum]QTQ15411.1 ClbS/DfsB family four-helix bundle protein [Treponema parvum]